MKQSDFKFIKPLLTKAFFEMRNTTGEPNLTVSINVKKHIIKVDGENKAAVRVLVQLNKLDSDKERSNIPFTAEVEMQSIFTWTDDLNEEAVDKLLNKNAPVLLLSYIRPIFSSLTSASPLPTYDLPFLDLTDKETSI